VDAGPGTAPPALTGPRLRQRSGLGARRAHAVVAAPVAVVVAGRSEGGMMAVELEELAGLLDKIASKEWRERCEGLQALQELVGAPPLPSPPLPSVTR
jgi:hypothetical protein